MKKFLIILVALVVLGGGIFMMMQGKKPTEPNDSQVQVAKNAEKANYADTITFNTVSVKPGDNKVTINAEIKNGGAKNLREVVVTIYVANDDGTTVGAPQGIFSTVNGLKAGQTEKFSLDIDLESIPADVAKRVKYEVDTVSFEE